MNCRSFVLLVVAWVAVGANGADFTIAAQIRTVGLGGEFNFSTIQGAINAASDGDTIVVSPDIYTGSIDFLTKNIHLESTNPADAGVREATILAPPTRIDASTNGSLQGFRINGQIAFGYNNYPDVRSFSPHISNNHRRGRPLLHYRMASAR